MAFQEDAAVPVSDHMYTNNCPEDIIELRGADLEIGAECAIGEANLPEAVIIEDQEIPHDQSGHHTGPISEGLILDKRARQKSFSKRLKTFEKQAQMLYSSCGAREIQVKVVAESGKVHNICLPTRHQRHVKLQVGEASEGLTREIPVRARGSPKKKTPPQIVNLPGKKSCTVPPVRQNNKCLCGVIYLSKKDKEFKKKHKIQATWLGCDREGCDTWGHAFCLKKIIRSKQSAQKVKFDCGKH